MPDQVPDEIKHERIERLIEVVQRVAEARNQGRIGRVEEVLVEGPSRTDESLLRGRTRRNTTVNFTGSAQPGELVPVEIEAATSTTLRGTEQQRWPPEAARPGQLPPAARSARSPKTAGTIGSQKLTIR
jgi:tRNA-2-methylthio-N6-dimethylallyladenosine synthase